MKQLKSQLTLLQDEYDELTERLFEERCALLEECDWLQDILAKLEGPLENDNNFRGVQGAVKIEERVLLALALNLAQKPSNKL